MMMCRKEFIVYAAGVFLILLVGLPLPAKAAELTGFGPIKFGMTKEEAWAAIDGKGEWLGNSSLIYEISVDRGTIPLTVYQGFTDGRAVEPSVFYDTPKGGSESHASCREKTLIIAGLIQEKYNKTPLAHYEAKEKTGKDRLRDFSIFDTLLFSFPRGAHIKISSDFILRRKGDLCKILVIYRPPTDDEIPF